MTSDPTSGDRSEPALDRRGFLLGGAAFVALGGGLWALYRQLADADATGDGAPVPDVRTGDPQQGWSELTSLVDGKGRGAYAVHAILLASGEVLVIGGAATDFFEFLLDPTASGPKATVVPLKLPMEQRLDYLECAGHAYLVDGRLLIAGGSRTDGDENEQGLAYAVLFDPADGSWTRMEEEMAGGGGAGIRP